MLFTSPNDKTTCSFNLDHIYTLQSSWCPVSTGTSWFIRRSFCIMTCIMPTAIHHHPTFVTKYNRLRPSPFPTLCCCWSPPATTLVVIRLGEEQINLIFVSDLIFPDASELFPPSAMQATSTPSYCYLFWRNWAWKERSLDIISPVTSLLQQWPDRDPHTDLKCPRGVEILGLWCKASNMALLISSFILHFTLGNIHVAKETWANSSSASGNLSTPMLNYLIVAWNSI